MKTRDNTQEGGCDRCGKHGDGMTMSQAADAGWWFTPPTDAPDGPDAYCPECAAFLRHAVLRELGVVAVAGHISGRGPDPHLEVTEPEARRVLPAETYARRCAFRATMENNGLRQPEGWTVTPNELLPYHPGERGTLLFAWVPEDPPCSP